MPLTTSVSVSWLSNLTTQLDHGVPGYPLRLDANISLTNGVGLSQADLVWSDQRTLIASATEDLDLSGVLTNPLGGGLLTFARIKGLFVKAATTNTNNVNVSRPASNGVPIFLAVSDGIGIPPGGIFVWMAPTAAGIPVTTGTGDLITLTNSAGTTSVVYDIVILGASA